MEKGAELSGNCGGLLVGVEEGGYVRVGWVQQYLYNCLPF